MNKVLAAVIIAGLLLGFSSLDIIGTSKADGKPDNAKDIPVLMYHHLLKEDENPFKDNASIISVENFTEQMKFLYENGYKTITLEELERYLKGELLLPQKSILLTFDDGYLSNYLYAYPVLKEYNFKAAVFMITSLINDTPEDFNPNRLNYLSWAEMDKARDVFEYASHTHDLHHLSGGKGYVITKDIDLVREDLLLTMDLLGSNHFAYPYGHYNSETLEVLEELGFTMAFTTKEGRVKPGDSMLELKRHAVYPYTTIRQFGQLVK